MAKHYIELREIFGFRLICRHCQGSLSVGVKDQVNTSAFHKCPHCNQAWTFDDITGPAAMEPAISCFVDAVRILAGVLDKRSKSDGGFSFVLEIEADAMPNAGEKTKRWL